MISELLTKGPLLVNPEHVTWFEALANKLESSGRRVEELQAALDDDEDGFWAADSWARPYRVTKDGTLVIPVHGVLLNKFPYQFGGLATGYEYIEAAVQRGARDDEVRQIVLDIESRGGLAAGMEDASNVVYEARAVKPIEAVANDHAYSAAYGIASAASRLTVAKMGGVGSIGTMSMHVDFSERLEKDGVKVTFVYRGKHKIDGVPELPLSEQAFKQWDKRVGALNDIFVALVARNRGLSEEAVRATEAACFMASEAVENGLADRVGRLDDLLAAYAENFNQEGMISPMEDTMSDKNDTAVDQAAHDQAVAEAKAEGVREGATAERGRISAIMDSDEGKARPKAARHVALNSAMSVEEAKTFLAGLDEEKQEAPAPAESEAPAPAGKSAFAQAMEATPNPDLGAGAEESQGSFADEVFASVGYGPVAKQ